jgi:lipoyl(octanoyl) transferase
MRAFTAARDANTPDELWLLQHPPVFTLGQAGRREHILDAGGILVIQTDRGGQVTYHGPGQLIVYLLFDLRRAGIGVKHLVHLLEQVVIDLLAGLGINALSRLDAPGVYVDGAKIAALGLRVRQGSSYHGLALNVDMNLEPYRRINPCGFPKLRVTQIADLAMNHGLDNVAEDLGRRLSAALCPSQANSKPPASRS